MLKERDYPEIYWAAKPTWTEGNLGKFLILLFIATMLMKLTQKEPLRLSQKKTRTCC